MTMTDPIADMLTRIRNANLAMHDAAEMPSSKVKEALAEILRKEGYIEGFDVADDPTRPGRKLTITLKYTSDRRRTISGIKRVSKPGLRVYTAADRVPRVLGGMGIAVLSTNQGLLTDREARQRRVGGEILCQVW
ncbi:MAG: 30S ribosomal protein S8 [Actinobacteria bacterium]|nr:30S ribosomal protein S8 [Actinomycetota bacterium]